MFKSRTNILILYIDSFGWCVLSRLLLLYLLCLKPRTKYSLGFLEKKGNVFCGHFSPLFSFSFTNECERIFKKDASSFLFKLRARALAFWTVVVCVVVVVIIVHRNNYIAIFSRLL